MQAGSHWGGNYSRFTFDETKNYFFMMKEQGVPVLDEEFNLLQEIQLTFLRRFIQDMLGDGSPNDGFRVVATGADNDFTIRGGDGTLNGAGHFYIGGYLLVLPSDTSYSAQPVPQPALTTPAGDRVDTVYLDVYLDEIDPIDDPDIVDPSLNVETSRRLQLKWEIKVAENAATAPPAYTDSNGLPHFIHAVATLDRTGTPAIESGMVTDIRRASRVLHGEQDGGNLHAIATSSLNGFMSAEDKSKLDTVERHATGREIPEGSRMLFVQPAAPEGWVQDNTINDRVIRVVDDSGVGGDQGGDWVLSGLTMPHGHNVSGNTRRQYDSQAVDSADGGGISFVATTSHIHIVDGSTTTQTTEEVISDGSWRPAYVDVIACVKT